MNTNRNGGGPPTPFGGANVNPRPSNQGADARPLVQWAGCDLPTMRRRPSGPRRTP
jgi:hypothetical protein